MIQARSVLVGKADYDQLINLVAKADSESVSLLFDELDAATIVTDKHSLKNVVVMGSVVTFLDIDTKEKTTLELVFPAKANPSQHRISILAPVGAALIGLRVGETIEWPIPGGKYRRLEVTAVENNRAENISVENNKGVKHED